MGFAPSCLLPVPDSVTPAMHLHLAVAVPSKEQQSHLHCTPLGGTGRVRTAAPPQRLSSSSTEPLLHVLCFSNPNLFALSPQPSSGRSSPQFLYLWLVGIFFCLVSYLFTSSQQRFILNSVEINGMVSISQWPLNPDWQSGTREAETDAFDQGW